MSWTSVGSDVRLVAVAIYPQLNVLGPDALTRSVKGGSIDGDECSNSVVSGRWMALTKRRDLPSIYSARNRPEIAFERTRPRSHGAKERFPQSCKEPTAAGRAPD